MSGDAKQFTDTYAKRKAEEHNCDILYGDDHTLLLDLDSDAAFCQFDELFRIAREQNVMVFPSLYEVLESKSGNRHVIIRLHTPQPLVTRLLLQAALGSDRKRETPQLPRYGARPRKADAPVPSQEESTEATRRRRPTVTDRPLTKLPEQIKWDARFLQVASLVAGWSKDPSTQTGAVITDRQNRIVSLGYNGFAAGVLDHPSRYEDRELKYKMIVHCERNAIIFAGRDLTGCTLYTYPFMSCAPCAAMVIQAGIKRVVAPKNDNPRWQEDFRLAQTMFDEAAVKVDLL